MLFVYVGLFLMIIMFKKVQIKSDRIYNKLSKNHIMINYQDALLNIITNSEKILILNYKNKECYKCKYAELGQIKKSDNISIRLSTYYPSYEFQVFNRLTNEPYCQDTLSKAFHFGENGTYSLEIMNTNESRIECNFRTIQQAQNIYLPLIIAASSLLALAFLYAFLKFAYKKYYSRLSSSYANSRIVNTDFGTPIITQDSSVSSSANYLLNEQDSLRLRQNRQSTRIKSVDVLRGICLSIMIFVNFGAGGYSFLDHAVWNGLNLADTVFPLFVFLMGVSIPLSMKSLLKKSINPHGQLNIRIRCFLYKILKRTLLLFFFGLLTSNSSENFLSQLRIMGVLQRFSISYFVCALIELFNLHLNNYNYLTNSTVTWETVNSRLLFIKTKFKEIFLYLIQWLIICFLMVVWLLLTFLLPVDGCPSGYLGPGGLHENASHFNCTGGAAGYIDRLILGEQHLYQEPTSKLIYKNQIPYDPEGLLGCLTSCVLTYLGMATGHVIIHYQQSPKRLARFLFYALVYALIALGLCGFSWQDGFIPINKNLWSLSFIFLMASIGLFAICFLYLLIDIFDIYSGTPFLYLGRNSITIYICHIIFGNYFPNFKVQNTHSYILANNIYWVTVWCIVAGIMNFKKIFINL